MLTLYQISLETFGVVISPGVAVFVFVALESVADVAEPQASVCIALAFDV